MLSFSEIRQEVRDDRKDLSLFGTFYKQWGEFKTSLEKVGDRIKQADAEWEKLTSTRSNALERPLQQIDDLRRQRGILESQLIGDDVSSATSKGDCGTKPSTQ